MTLNEKKKLFAFGLQIFIQKVCGQDQATYTDFMVAKDGYRESCKQFYLKSGRLTEADRDALFDNGVVPDWMKDCFMRVEQHFFGSTLFTI